MLIYPCKSQNIWTNIVMDKNMNMFINKELYFIYVQYVNIYISLSIVFKN